MAEKEEMVEVEEKPEEAECGLTDLDLDLS